MRKLIGTVTAIIFCLFATSLSAKDSVNVWVGFNVGGGFDASARLFAKHFSKHLPGNPNVIVRNKPGGGSIKLLNFMYMKPNTSGFDIGFFHPQAIQMLLYGKRELRFKPEGFRYIGNMYSDVNSCVVWRGAGQNIKTFGDLKNAKQPVVFGAARPTSMMSAFPHFFKNVLGANLRVIQGYRGTRATTLAMARGELQGTCGIFESSLKGLYRSQWNAGDINVFIQLDTGKKSDFFGPDTTLLSSLLKTKEQRQIAEFVFGIERMTRPVLASSGLPKANIKILRKAFMDTMRDPALHRDFEKILGITPDPVDGFAVQKFFKSLAATPKDIIQKAWTVTRLLDVKR